MKMAYNVSQLINDYECTSSGHFFKKDTMRFFKSKVLGEFKRLDDRNALFITSEVNPSGNKAYTIRHATMSNKYEYSDTLMKIDIDTVGEFHSLGKSEAIRLLKHLVIEQGQLIEIL
jgi:hypothetical protein